MTDKYQVYYGFYSLEAHRKWGSIWWIDENGQEVEITTISVHQDGHDYKWADKKLVGRVVRFSRHGGPIGMPLDGKGERSESNR